MARSLTAEDFAAAVEHLGDKSRSAVSATPSDALPAPVRARIAVFEEGARERVKAAVVALGDKKDLLAVLAQRAMEPRIGAQERVKRFRVLVDTWSNGVAPYSACARGCSHCCHIPVAVFASEARIIGKELGREVRPLPDGHTPDLASYGYDRPCVFLKDGACSIYASRPLSCRLQFNMDADALLCELVQGTTVPVPYADRRQFEVMVAAAFYGDTLADVREWFAPAAVKPPQAP